MKKYLTVLSSLILTSFSLQPLTPASAIDLMVLGPGERIHGADIRRWQHPDQHRWNRSHAQLLL